jgi:hypothetical protein
MRDGAEGEVFHPQMTQMTQIKKGLPTKGRP